MVEDARLLCDVESGRAGKRAGHVLVWAALRGHCPRRLPVAIGSAPVRCFWEAAPAATADFRRPPRWPEAPSDPPLRPGLSEEGPLCRIA